MRHLQSCFVAAAVVLIVAPMVSAQSWVHTIQGPAPGDSGPRIDAIVVRQMLNIAESSARLEDGDRVIYNHPSMLCQTREGTMIFMWNGGPSEAESQNRIFFSRLEKGASQWAEPKRLENRQIDFGTIFQPSKPGAPVLAGYWYGDPSGAQSGMMISHDDGKTWSDPRPFPTSDDPFWAPRPSQGHLRWAMSPPVVFHDGTLWFASEGQFRYPAIVIVPPDNYTGQTPGGAPWSTIHDNGLDKGILGDFLVLTPDRRSVIYIMRWGGNYLTTDGGKTWTDVPRIPKGGAGVAALSLDVDGGPAQGWHVTAGCNHPARHRGLFVWISKDPTNASSWKQVLQLHEDVGGEDADPSMIQTPDRKIHLLFTGRGEELLKYYILDPDKLIADAPPAQLPDDWPGRIKSVQASQTAAGVEVSWTETQNVTGYKVYRRMFEDGEPTYLVAEVPAGTTTATDTAELGRGRYGYKVIPYNDSTTGQYTGTAVSISGQRPQPGASSGQSAAPSATTPRRRGEQGGNREEGAESGSGGGGREEGAEEGGGGGEGEEGGAETTRRSGMKGAKAATPAPGPEARAEAAAATRAGDWLINGDQSAIVDKKVIETGAAYNHPANIEQLANGDLIIVSVAGEGEGESTAISAVISTDNGATWSDPIGVSGVSSYYDPTVQQAANGDVYCFYYLGCCNNHKWRVSTDNGRTWGSEHDVSDAIGSRDPVSLQAGEQSNALRHPNGDWLCGWSEGKTGGRQGYTSHIPKGALGDPAQWTKHWAIDQFWNPAFLVLNPDNAKNGHYQEILAVMRTQFHNSGDGSDFALSTDGGVTFKPIGKIGFTSTVGDRRNTMHAAAPTGVSLDLDGGALQGWHVIAQSGDAMDPAKSDCPKGRRCQRHFMRVAVSNSGDPKDWQLVLELRERTAGGENADCSIIQDTGGNLHLIWTGRGTSGIRYMKLDAATLVGGRAQ